MTLFSLAELEAAAVLVAGHVPPTPTFAWPLLSRRTGAEVWVKHENHTPTGAFKVRGGIVFMAEFMQAHRGVKGVITATRGNHGQSIARAAKAVGVAATIVVPRGNSVEKNAAMRGFGAELIEHDDDFDEAKGEAARLATERGHAMVPSFGAALVKGVATYALELFRSAPSLDAVLVPIGLGSGICGVITARDLLGLETEVYGVVAANAPGYALSFAQGQPVATNSARTFADGVAVREPNPAAFDIIRRGAAGVLTVSEDEIADAIRAYFEDCHALAEGAGAVPLAGLMQQAVRFRGKRVGLVLSGGNIDRPVFAKVLAGETPAV
jgi:threonine dehydratase